MADTFRYKYGDTNPVNVTFDTAYAIEIGDLMFLDSGDSYNAKPASAFTWDTDLATTQAAFHPLFIGVAMQRYDGSNTDAYGIKDGKIRIATTGVFEFTCASASFAVGALVGPAKQSGNALEDQKVASVATESLAVGRAVEETSSETTVDVRIRSPRATLSA